MLGLAAGLVGRYLGYIDKSVSAIFLASLGACLAWDLITFIAFRLKIRSLINKKRYVFEIPGEENKYIQVTGNDGFSYLLFCENKNIWKKFVEFRKQDSPIIEQSILRSVSIADIHNIIEGCNYAGVAVIERKEIIIYPMEG